MVDILCEVCSWRPAKSSALPRSSYGEEVKCGVAGRGSRAPAARTARRLSFESLRAESPLWLIEVTPTKLMHYQT